jgi:hypothetical protein
MQPLVARSIPLVTFGAWLAWCLAATPLAAGAGGNGPKPANASLSAAKSESPERTWGVRPVSIRTTAAGYMLYFRYKVVDAEKAKPLFDRRIKPVLFDHATGARLSMPEDSKLGALRATPRNPPVNGKEYYVLFSNPAGRLKKGSEVSVAIGDCKSGRLVVE